MQTKHTRKPLIQRPFAIHPVGATRFFCPKCKSEELREKGPDRMSCPKCEETFLKTLVPSQNEKICQPFIFIQAVL